MNSGNLRSARLAGGFLLSLLAASASPAVARPPAAQAPAGGTNAQKPLTLFEDIVVTASAQAEPIVQTGATVQVLDSAAIDASSATTVTELLAERGIAYFDQWSPSQTQINMRGATSDGQGRDFRSQIVVLINGRRAGTSNISKLSLHELERIEIVRGPGSLLYGSQAIGGVINLITRTGIQGASESLMVNAGSWGAAEGAGHYSGVSGKFDYSFGGHGGRRGNYSSGDDSPGPMLNTAFSQGGGLAAFGYSRSANERISVTARMDGIFHAGFRGSQYDISDYDNRYNQSIETVYNRVSRQGRVSFTGQYYFFRDVDDLRWGSKIIQNDDGTPGPGFDHDNNFRANTGHGVKANGVFNWAAGSTLLAGVDTELSQLRSTRERHALPGGPSGQAPPFDNNADTWVNGIYAEEVQKFLQDRLTLRGGARFDYGRESIRATPNRPLLAESTADYTSMTYRAGIIGRVHPAVALRAGVGTGYRAPTPTELTANFITIGGGQIIGNANLDPEQNISVDAGAAIKGGPLTLDLDLFHSRIRNRISTASIGGNRRQYVNRASSDVTGLEAQARAELGSVGDVAFWAGMNGVYNFVMRDNDAAAQGLNSDRIDRMNQYLGSIQLGIRHRRGWTAQLSGALEGPLWYDTEEYLLIPAAEPFDGFIHRKDPYWLWNATAKYPLTRLVRLRASATNLANANVHPTFISLNKAPFLSDPRFSNGGGGNSLPGRGFLLGVEVGR